MVKAARGSPWGTLLSYTHYAEGGAWNDPLHHFRYIFVIGLHVRHPSETLPVVLSGSIGRKGRLSSLPNLHRTSEPEIRLTVIGETGNRKTRKTPQILTMATTQTLRAHAHTQLRGH